MPLYNERWPGEKKELWKEFTIYGSSGVAEVREFRMGGWTEKNRAAPDVAAPELLYSSPYSDFSTSLFEPCASETTSPDSRDCL